MALDITQKIKQLLQSTDESHHHLAFQLMRGWQGDMDWQEELHEVIYRKVSRKSLLALQYGFSMLFDKHYLVDLSGLDIQELPSSVRDLKSMKHLNLAKNPNLNIQQAFEIISELPSLIELSLNKTSLITLPAKINRNLVKLSLSDNPSLNIEAVMQTLVQLEHLKDLDLSGVEERFSTFPDIILSKLEKLEINQNNFLDLKQTFRVLKKYPTLTHLALNDFDDINFSNILILQHLEVLELDYIHLHQKSAEEIQNLFKILGEFPNLHTLKLKGNFLGDLPESIVQLQNIRVLDLSNNHFSYKYFDHIVAVLQKMNLRELYVYGNTLFTVDYFNNEGYRLIESLPDTKVFTD
jgi:Leucine-rich repeat (LRR) protein